MSADKVFSEVYNVVVALGEEYKTRIAADVWETIEKERNLDYSPFIDENKPLDEQDISMEAINMIALLYRDYWCDTDEKKEKFAAMLQVNEKKLQETLDAATTTRELMKLLKEKQ